MMAKNHRAPFPEATKKTKKKRLRIIILPAIQEEEKAKAAEKADGMEVAVDKVEVAAVMAADATINTT